MRVLPVELLHHQLQQGPVWFSAGRGFCFLDLRMEILVLGAVLGTVLGYDLRALSRDRFCSFAGKSEGFGWGSVVMFRGALCCLA